MGPERYKFGGWEPDPGKPGEYRAKIVMGPVNPEFAKFSEESRARWDMVEWLKVKIKHLLERGTPTKKGD